MASHKSLESLDCAPAPSELHQSHGALACPGVDPTCPNAASSHPESKDPGIPPNPRAAHELSHSLPGDAKGIMIH